MTKKTLANNHNPGEQERVTGYLGERSVERFFLLRGINANIVENCPYDVLIWVGDSFVRCQVKATRKSKFSVGSGRSRSKDYAEGSIDVFAFVQLEKDGRDAIFFLTPDELGVKSVGINSLKISFQGESGWERVVDTLKKKGVV